MKRKIRKRKNRSAASVSEKLEGKTSVDSAQEESKTEPENPFDFGGLPPRDLKKNLGCG